MLKLIKKEFSLCLHPASAIFMLFGAFVLIPNYPYTVMFFFCGLGAFFIALTGRENGDYAFTCSMPVKKEQVAYARILLCVCLQMGQLFVALVCTLIKTYLFPVPNLAGTDCGIVFFGVGFFMIGVLNAVFFPLHFAKPTKVGVPFLIASIALFFGVVADVALQYALPVWSVLEQAGGEYLAVKLGVLFGGVVFFVAATVFSLAYSGKRFAKVDL